MARLCALGVWLWFRGECICEAEKVFFSTLNETVINLPRRSLQCIQACPILSISWSAALGLLANPVTDCNDAMLYVTGAVAQQPDLDLGALFEGGELEYARIL